LDLEVTTATASIKKVSKKMDEIKEVEEEYSVDQSSVSKEKLKSGFVSPPSSEWRQLSDNHWMIHDWPNDSEATLKF